jgi:sigma-B regulation protein RsbU (phosphoserine phosphatase)
VIRAVVVDDEPPARVRLRQLLEAAGGVTVVGEAGSAMEARAVIRDLRPDLLFLDVDMPEVRGTALAASLPEPRPFIVFATAHDNYGLDAIAVDATDYLLKPVSRARLAATLERVRSRLNKQSDLERDVAAASAVQAQMWPGTLPAIDGFDCAAASLPARGVGGDFYDLFPLETSRWALLLGDASGKGMAAGLVASAVQARVHTAARLARLDPVALMAAVDRDVYATTDGARYATAVYASFDSATRSFSIVNAGHPAILVDRGPAASSTRIDATGPALGLIEAGVFSAREVTLMSGEVLIAYTDGVIEARNPQDEEFGDARLASLVAAGRDLTAADLCARTLDAVRQFRKERQDQDDVTVFVVRAR